MRSSTRCPPRRVCTSIAAPAGTCFRTDAAGLPGELRIARRRSIPLNTQVRYIPENNRTGYVQSWHFTVQREIAKDLVLDVAYVGNHRVGLMILADDNQALPQPAEPESVAGRAPPVSRLSTPSRSPINGGFGSYNALQAKLEKRFRSGLLLPEFVHLVEGDRQRSRPPGELRRRQFARQLLQLCRSTRASPATTSRSTIRCRCCTTCRSATAATSSCTTRSLDSIAGGWGVNVINTMTSGLPLNITYGATTQASVSSLTTPRPNLTGASIYLSGGNPHRIT